jgi:predicted small lipoprotein YifL
MRTISVAIVLATAFALASCGSKSPFNPSNGAADEAPVSQTRDAAAKSGLETLREITRQTTGRGLGFASPEQARQAQLGSPMQIYVVQLDALRKYRETDKPDAAVVDAGRTFYPVEVDKSVVTSMTVAQSPNGFRATDFGNASIALGIARYRQSPDDIVVYIPVAKVYFIGRRTNGTLTLIPTVTARRFRLTAGQEVSASQVLLTVQAALRDYNGLPQ